MRIGLVTPAWPGKANGITTAVSHMVSGFTEIGHETTIIPIEQSKIYDRAVINLPLPRPWTLKERVYANFGLNTASVSILADRIAQAAKRAVQEHGIDALLMEETQGWGSVVQPTIPIPLIINLHGPWCIHKFLHSNSDSNTINYRREEREGQGLRLCAGITSPSQDVMNQVMKRYKLSNIPKAIIPNPMPLKPAINYETLDDIQKRSLLFVGRFDKHKGGDVIIEAFKKLIGQGADARLTFVGPDIGVVRQDGSRLHIADALAALPENVRARIDYRGLLNKDEIETLRRQHAVTVIASRYENLNYTLLEALATGCATVATAVGGPLDTIRDGETGLLVPTQDPTALAAACRRLLENPSLSRRLGCAARQVIFERFSNKYVATQMLNFIQNIINSKYVDSYNE